MEKSTESQKFILQIPTLGISASNSMPDENNLPPQQIKRCEDSARNSSKHYKNTIFVSPISPVQNKNITYVTSHRNIQKMWNKHKIIVNLYRMGFSLDKIELAVLAAGTEKLEDALKYLCKENNVWPHFPLTRREILLKINNGNNSGYCLTCYTKKDNICGLNMSDSPLNAISPTINNQEIPIPSKKISNQIYPCDFIKVSNGNAIMNTKYKEFECLTPKRKKDESILDNSSTNQNFSSVSFDLSRYKIHDASFCYICGDKNESHVPKPELETSKTDLHKMRKPYTQKFLQKYNVLNANIEIKPTPEICDICYEENKQMCSLGCSHAFCIDCLKLYIIQCMKDLKKIECPLLNCRYIISTEFIIQNTDHLTFENYKLELLKRKTENKIIYCPACSQANKRNEDGKSKIQCSFCKIKFCGRCVSFWHARQTCEAYYENLYNKICKGREWQFCPNCGKVIKRSPKCGHMMCPECLLTFCVSCRKRIRGGSNAEMDDCFMRKRTLFTEDEHPKKKCMWLKMFMCLLLFFILTPFIAVLFIPYVTGVNTYDYFMYTDNTMNSVGIHDFDETINENNGASSINSSEFIIRKPKESYKKDSGFRSDLLCKGVIFTILAVLLCIIFSPISMVCLIFYGIIRYIIYLT